jgi:hypothetical protein
VPDTTDEIANRLARLSASPPGVRLDVEEIARRAQRRGRRRRQRRATLGLGVLAVVSLVTGVTIVGGGEPPPEVQTVAGDEEPSLVTPSEGLFDGQTVAIDMTGLAPYTSGAMCAADATLATSSSACDLGTMAPVGDRASYVVHRLIDVESGRRDCAEPATPCSVAVGVPGGPITFVPVSFDPARPPLAEPTLTAEGAMSIPGDGTVAVRATGFPPGQEVRVKQCPAGLEWASCDFQASLLTTVFVAGEDGSFAGDAAVTRRIFPWDGPVDCALQPCRLLTEHPTFGRAEAVIQFSPDAPLDPLPSIAVSPAGPHRFGQAVQVTGSHFAADADIEIAICFGDPGVDDDRRICLDSQVFTRTDGQGSFMVDSFVLGPEAQLGGCLADAGCYLAYAPGRVRDYFPSVAAAALPFLPN